MMKIIKFIKGLFVKSTKAQKATIKTARNPVFQDNIRYIFEVSKAESLRDFEKFSDINYKTVERWVLGESVPKRNSLNMRKLIHLCDGVSEEILLTQSLRAKNRANANKITEKDVAIYVARNIKQFRKLRGMTQADLGQAIGLTPSAIGLYERGKVNVPLSRTGDIAKALGVREKALFAKRLPKEI